MRDGKKRKTFFLEIRSHKKKRTNDENIYTTCIRYQQIRQRDVQRDVRRRKYVDRRMLQAKQAALPHRQTPESPTHRRRVFRAMFHPSTYAAFIACTLEAYSVIQHHAEGCLCRDNIEPGLRPVVLLLFPCTMLALLSIAGWKTFFLDSRCLCSGHTTAKAEVGKKAECRFVLFFAALKYDSSVYLPDFIFQFVQKFQPALLLFARSSRRIF